MNPSPPSDPQAVERVLALLRRWGWEAAAGRLRDEIAAATDPGSRADLEALSGWLAAERGGYEEARALFAAAGVRAELKGWGLVGGAFVDYRERRYDDARRAIELAALCAVGDTALTATLEHLRGAVAHMLGRPDDALEHLYAALDGFGLDHFGTGRVLDTLGMIYATRNDFPNAVLFYHRAEELKRAFGDRPDDLAGLALTYGQLGRLYLDWHQLDRAEEYFRRDLQLCVRILDRRGEAQMHNHLAQVWLRRGRPTRALEHLDQSVRLSEEGKWPIPEGYARKDRAAARVAQGDPTGADADLDRAYELFGQVEFHEGMAHLDLVRATVRSAQGLLREAAELLRRAAVWFDNARELDLGARAQLELARLYRQSGGTLGLPREALVAALDRAERTGRDALVAEVQRELAEVDEAELYRRLYGRARGRGIRDDIGVMERAVGETATVLFLDLRDSTKFVMREDPAVVRLTLNQLFAAITQALEPHRVAINQYLGDGFMALSREGDHARNAVSGALDVLRALDRFNRPRRALGQKVLEARIGISTGPVVLGNIGTHHKLDFTAVGPATNEAARLQGKARPGLACVSRSTHAAVGDRFEYADPDGREVDLAGVDGPVRVWDVRGRAGG